MIRHWIWLFTDSKLLFSIEFFVIDVSILYLVHYRFWKKKKYFTHTFLVVVSYVTYFTYIFVVVWLSLSELMLVFFGFTLLLFGVRFDVWVFRFRLFDICFALSTLHTPPQIYFFSVLSCHHEISLWCFYFTDSTFLIVFWSYWNSEI